MKFHFESNQPFQLRAIEAAADLFRGQPRTLVDFGDFALGRIFGPVANRLDLDDAHLLANLRAVQKRNGLPEDGQLACIEDTIRAAGGDLAARFPNYSVEMETGTGKTYVYLRTALELHRRYGLRKFIVVVPSVAVREGVLKTLKITQDHLRGLYDNVPYRFTVYDSKSISKVRQFAQSGSVELLVMTIDSFNKEDNVIRQSADRFQGATPIHLVQAARPVLILDEPQNMESEGRIRALATLIGRQPVPNLVEMLEDLIAHISPPIKLTRRTLAAIVTRTKNRQAALDNPQEFASQAARILREKAVQQLVDGIQYFKDGTWYEMSQWVEEEESVSERLLSVDKSIYDHIVCESETERKFAEQLKRFEHVRLFVKLPRWFQVKTPVGGYNPDWGIVVEKTDAHGDPGPLLYLIRETKSTTAPDELRGTENQKIHCGERHFQGALEVDYKVVRSADELV